jgi:hypothetical protein
MTSIAILTAVYDSYDALKPTVPQDGVEVDWVCVTDDEDLKGETSVEGWRVVYEPRPGVHPNRAAKHPKYEPWKYTDADASIWVDASFRIISGRFAAEAITHANPIAQFVHPWRDCLYAEAAESAPMVKYAGEPILEQAEHYRTLGHPERWGLWATGIIARRHTDAVRELGRMWLEETYRWSFQDQISHPHACREVGLRPAVLPGTHMSTPWLRYEGSARHACG